MEYGLNYERLLNISKTTKPFRGTTNRFPIGDRRHNTKCFYVIERDGEQVFQICYGKDYQTHYHTEEEYKADPVNIYHYEWEKEGAKYQSFTPMPRELGVVRSDNTFEFTAPLRRRYGQGDNIVMSGWGIGYFYRSSRHGGMVYTNSHRHNVFYPIFKGLRVDMTTMKPIQDFRVVGKRVSRKDAKQFLCRYEDFYKVNEVMMKATTWNAVLETGKDLFEEVGMNFDNWYLVPDMRDRMLELAEQKLNDAPLDALVAFAIGFEINHMYSRVRSHVKNDSYRHRDEDEVLNLYTNVKRKLNKELYKRNPSVMKTIEYTPNSFYPPSEWGVEIYVGDTQMEQY